MLCATRSRDVSCNSRSLTFMNNNSTVTLSLLGRKEKIVRCIGSVAVEITESYCQGQPLHLTGNALAASVPMVRCCCIFEEQSTRIYGISYLRIVRIVAF